MTIPFLTQLKIAWDGWIAFASEAKVLGLFFPVLLAFLFFGKKIKKEVYLPFAEKSPSAGNLMLLGLYSLIASFLVICPVSAALLKLYQTHFYGYEALWILPAVLPVFAGILARFFSCLGAASHETVPALNGKKGIMALVLTICLLLLAGQFPVDDPGKDTVLTLTKSGEACIAPENHILLEALANMDKIRIAEGKAPFVLCGPDSLMAQARMGSASLCTLYGRDLWDISMEEFSNDTYSEELIALRSWICDLEEKRSVISLDPLFFSNLEMGLAVMKENGASLAVLPRAAFDVVELGESELDRIGSLTGFTRVDSELPGASAYYILVANEE